ncbi:MAG: hypothetical protein PHU03_03055 [Syntrophales bacterium]|nr:hypothetical protein [Syntrophales bacterium]
MKRKPRLLDLYCKAGGGAKGYHRAGFEVYGIDYKPQPHYPFSFIQMDALEALDRLLRGEGLTFSNGSTLYLVDFSAYHASPPCQRHSQMTKKWGRQREHPDLISPTRKRLVATGKTYVIENVEGAPLENPVMLCGTMFGLHSGEYWLRRHRIFESNINLFAPATCCHQGKALPVYGHAGGTSKRDGLTFPGTDAWREGMGIDWMVGNELAEAIPPAFTEHIGKYLMQAVLEEKQRSYKSVANNLLEGK